MATFWSTFALVLLLQSAQQTAGEREPSGLCCYMSAACSFVLCPSGQVCATLNNTGMLVQTCYYESLCDGHSAACCDKWHCNAPAGVPATESTCTGSPEHVCGIVPRAAATPPSHFGSSSDTDSESTIVSPATTTQLEPTDNTDAAGLSADLCCYVDKTCSFASCPPSHLCGTLHRSGRTERTCVLQSLCNDDTASCCNTSQCNAPAGVAPIDESMCLASPASVCPTPTGAATTDEQSLRDSTNGDSTPSAHSSNDTSGLCCFISAACSFARCPRGQVCGSESANQLVNRGCYFASLCHDHNAQCCTTSQCNKPTDVHAVAESQCLHNPPLVCPKPDGFN